MPLGKYQMLEAKTWKGTTVKNHLHAIYKASPQKATDVMIQFLAQHRGKSLENYLMKFPVKYFETDDEYYWELIGSSRRNLPLVEARYQGAVVTDSDTGIGAGNSQFDLVFEEDYFAEGNRIVGERNEVYPIRILKDRPEGILHVYTCELMGGVVGGMPGEELVAGKRFSVDYSPVEDTMSREVGDVRFTSPISMRNEWTTLRIKHKAPGNMLDRKVFMGIPFVNKEGKKGVHTMWMHHVDYVIEETFSEEKNKAIMYSRSNRLANGEYQNTGKSGFVIKEGDGIRAQMEISNTIFYNDFDLGLVENILYNLSESKLGFGERTFVLRTGERGAAQFHKAVLQTTSGWQAFSFLRGSDHPAIITQTSSNLHTNALSAGFQFTEFKAPNGVTVKVEVDPIYDDRERNKIMHPDGGVAESYRYDILYIGSTEVPNIQICKVRGQEEYRGYQWGPFRNPFTGDQNNPYASYDEDSAVIHKYATLGAVIYDSSRTASLIPSILA